MKKTKIICTLGPATSDPKMQKRIIEAGCDVVRCNFSHGTYAEHKTRIESVRKIAGLLKKPVAVLQDLQGPKIRLGKFAGGKALLEKGKIIALTSSVIEGDASKASVTYWNFAGEIRKNDLIYFNDGLIKVAAERISEDRVYCRIIEGGWVSDGKGVNLPGSILSASSLTKKDKKDLMFGIKLDVDFVAISFVRTARDIKKIKRIIEKTSRRIPVIAKIEKPQAVENIAEIIKEADGIMVARGDLGVELGFEKVPSVQKMLIDFAGKEGIPVIVATQMLESMTVSPTPTRAEASDIANAVFEGADAVMLSAETAAGKYPVLSVVMMSKIICEAEKNSKKWPAGLGISRVKARTPDELDAIAEAVFNIAGILDISKIVIFTRSGLTARLMSKYRPYQEIIAFTPDEKALRQMALYRGVRPYLLGIKENAGELLKEMEYVLLSKHLAVRGEKVVVIFSLPVSGNNLLANTIKLHTLN